MKATPEWKLEKLKKRAKSNRHKSYSQDCDKLYDEQGGKCFYCKKPVRKENATLDHIIPLSRGGYNKRKNYVMACDSCNNEKGSMTKDEYIKFRSEK